MITIVTLGGGFSTTEGTLTRLDHFLLALWRRREVVGAVSERSGAGARSGVTGPPSGLPVDGREQVVQRLGAPDPRGAAVRSQQVLR